MVLSKKLLNIKLFPRTRSQAIANAASTNGLTRRFVLTGDERCPIAGIWSRLDTTQTDATDDPSLTQPAMGIAPWRPIHLLFTPLHYLPA